MIKVHIPSDKFYSILKVYELFERFQDRKYKIYYRKKEDILAAGLNDEKHMWMKDNTIIYDLDCVGEYDRKWYILFENKKDAMLFKLIWL